MFNYVLPIFNHLANSIAFVTHNPLHNYYNRCKNKLPEESFPFRQPKSVVIAYENVTANNYENTVILRLVSLSSGGTAVYFEQN